jgi:hypothetical protein
MKKGRKIKSKAESENVSAITGYLAEWEAVVNAEDLTGALINHFGYLADTSGFESVLKKILKGAIKARCNKERLEIDLSGDQYLIAYPPMKKIPKRYPSSYQQVLSRHEQLTLSNDLFLGEHGRFEWLEDGDSSIEDWGKAKDIICPLWDYSDGWIYHPKEKNLSGSPILYYISHEGGEINDPQPYNIGALFLKRCVEWLELEVEIPAAAMSANSTNDVDNWWNNLDDHWKKLLATNDITKASQAKKALSITNLNCEKIPLVTLEPIRLMERLTRFTCLSPYITDISPVAGLKHLDYLWLAGKISDITPLQGLKKLKTVNLSETRINDLNVFKNHPSLSKIYISKTDVEDISILKTVKNLEQLDLEETKVKNFGPIKELRKLRCLNISKTSVQSLEFLAELPLSELRINGTALSTLSPARVVRFLYCGEQSKISLQEALRFKMLQDRPGESVTLRIYGNFNETRVAFVIALENIDFDIRDFREVLSEWATEELEWIKHNNEPKELERRLLECVRIHGLVLGSR